MFSSVFDFDGLKFLESIGNPFYKISSFELNHIPLIDAVSKTKKPIIISGMGSDEKLNWQLIHVERIKTTNYFT